MGKSSGPKSVSTLTKNQQTLANQLINLLSPGTVGGQQNQLGSNSLIGTGATPYGGQIVPNLIPQFQQALGFLGQSGSQGQQTLNSSQGALNQLLSGQPTAPMVGSSLPANYLQQAITNPMMHQFNTVIAPQIKEGFGHVGAFSSAEGSSLANALSSQNIAGQQQFAQANFQQQQLAQQLNTQSAQQGRQLQATGVGLAGQLGQQQAMLPLQQALGVGAALQPFQQNLQAQGQANYQNFLRTTPENSPWTQLALGVTGQQQQALYNPQNQFGQAIGNIGSLGLLGSIFGLI